MIRSVPLENGSQNYHKNIFSYREYLAPFLSERLSKRYVETKSMDVIRGGSGIT